MCSAKAHRHGVCAMGLAHAQWAADVRCRAGARRTLMDAADVHVVQEVSARRGWADRCVEGQTHGTGMYSVPTDGHWL